MCLSITQDFLGSADFKLTDLVTDGGGKVELDLLDDDNQQMQESKVSLFQLLPARAAISFDRF